MYIGKAAIAAALGMAFLSAMTVASLAGPEGYCDPYARDVANRKARSSGADVFAGANLGKLTGTAIGTNIDSTEGSTVDEASGTTLGAAAANSKWRRAYINAYEDCMGQYEVEKVVAVAPQPEPEAEVAVQPADEPATEEVVIEEQPVVEEPVEEPVKKPAKAKAKAKAKSKLEPGTQAWNNACDKRYRSFDPKTGLYKSLSGKMRKCAL